MTVTEPAGPDPLGVVIREPPDLEVRLPGPYFVVPGEPPVALRVARDPGGKLVCTGLLVGWHEDNQPVTARSLAAIRLGSLLEVIAAMDEPEAVELREAGAVVGERGPDLEGWARSYRAAVAARPRAPIQHLVEETGMSHATVHRIIARCRDRGLLERRR